MSKERYIREHDYIIDNNKRKTNESLIVYDEEWNTLDDLCDLLNQQDKQIADLEAKLAEKDRAIENWQTMYQSVMQSCHNSIEEDKRLREQLAVQSKWLGALDEVIKQLKEQLADKNKEIEEKTNIIEFLNGFKNAVTEELKKELR